MQGDVHNPAKHSQQHQPCNQHSGYLRWLRCDFHERTLARKVVFEEYLKSVSELGPATAPPAWVEADGLATGPLSRSDALLAQPTRHAYSAYIRGYGWLVAGVGT